MVSVIVPIYNVEKYLNKCVDSILAQTYTDLEVILVNDGTKDSSAQIAAEYEKMDNRVRLINKENGGLSDARNVGIAMAFGEYAICIDSDDYIATDMIEILVRLIKDNDCDMAAGGICNVYGKNMVPQCKEQKEFVCDNVEAFGHIMVGELIPGSICNKLIKTDIYKSIEFPVGRLYEDAFFTTKLMQIIKKVAVTTKPLYYYVHREGSITTTPFKKRDYDLVDAYTINLKLIKDKYPAIMPQATFRLNWAYFTVLDRILLLENYSKNEYYSRVVKHLKRNAIAIFFNKYFRKSRRIAAIALLINVRLYRKLMLANMRKQQG
ncbi:MAG: glycosyltransferase family 2 protein [Lachnospiraceae bacterium]|nr:glycosyltransferase family 2 protein [Lachnospiraceae bacterium]